MDGLEFPRSDEELCVVVEPRRGGGVGSEASGPVSHINIVLPTGNS